MVTEDAVLSTTTNDVMANLTFRQDFPAFMFDELYSSDEEISTSEAMETISYHPSQSPLSDDMNSEYFNMNNLKDYILRMEMPLCSKKQG